MKRIAIFGAIFRMKNEKCNVTNVSVPVRQFMAITG